MAEPGFQSSAVAHANQDFIDLETESCRRLCFADPDGKHFHFDPAVDDATLGQAVVAALAASRALTSEEADELRTNSATRYQAWVASIMERHGYRSRRAMFRSLKSCTITLAEGRVGMEPMHRDGREGWSGEGADADDYVALAADSPAAEVGAALRLALSRARS